MASRRPLAMKSMAQKRAREKVKTGRTSCLRLLLKFRRCASRTTPMLPRGLMPGLPSRWSRSREPTNFMEADEPELVLGLPVGRGKHFLHDTGRLVDYALGNWRLSALQYYQSGQPITVT